MPSKAYTEWRDAAVDTLVACIAGIEAAPDGEVNMRARRQASALIERLAFSTLPGGSTMDQSGMRYGWSLVGEEKPDDPRALKVLRRNAKG